MDTFKRAFWIRDAWTEARPERALSTARLHVCFLGQGGGRTRGAQSAAGKEAGRGGDVALNTAEHRGAAAGGCITFSAQLQPAVHIVILHTLILPATNLDTFICVHFNGMPGSSTFTVA